MMFDPEILLWKDFDRGETVARFWQNAIRIWQKNDNDLSEHLCYIPDMTNWDFVRSPSFLVYITTCDRDA